MKARMFSVGPQKYRMLVVLNAVMFSFQQNTVEACTGSVITFCNDTTSCIQTHEEVYKLLGSNMNYFKIAKALYPAKKMSSLLVHVTLNGANGTEKCRPAHYTWSMSCLFAAFPEYVLEVLSLGSILVRSRTQKLDITIAPFCCNVSVENRVTIIEDVLSSLQDLAVSPGIQDPSLNTAECVTEGHEPNLTDTERKSYIIAAMFLSFGFTIFLGPWLAIYTLIYLDELSNGEDPAMYSALKWVSFSMLIGELGLFITSTVFLCKSNAALLKWLMLSILIVTLLKGPIVGCICFKKDTPVLDECKSWILQIVIFTLAYLTSCHFCWIVIGIMVNALWGVTVLLFVGVITTALFFTLYNFFKFVDVSDNATRNFFICLTLFMPVVCLVCLVIVAGQTVFGRNTVDEVVKMVILTVSIGFMKWTLPATKDTSKKSNEEQKKEKGGNKGDVPKKPKEKEEKDEKGKNKVASSEKSKKKEEKKVKGNNKGGESDNALLLQTRNQAEKQAEVIDSVC